MFLCARLHPRLGVLVGSYLTLGVLLVGRHWLRVQHFIVSEARVALEPTVVLLRAIRAVAAVAALHPGLALGHAVLEGLGAPAKGSGGIAAVLGVALVLVVLLEALGGVLLVARVGGVVALEIEVALVLVAAVVVMARAALVDVDVAALLVVRGCRAVTLNPDVALLDTTGAVVALDPDLALKVLGVLGRSLAPDVDVDVGVLGLLLLLGLLGLLHRLEARQEADDLQQSGVGNDELLLAVLQLLLLAEQPVDAVTDAHAAALLDVAANALRVRRDVLQGAAHIAHAAVHPLGLLRVGLEGIVDFADGQQALHFVEVGAHAADDAHVDGVGGTDIAQALGLVEELAELVCAAEGSRRRTERKDLALDHGGEVNVAGKGVSGVSMELRRQWVVKLPRKLQRPREIIPCTSGAMCEECCGGWRSVVTSAPVFRWLGTAQDDLHQA
jgi:hypothetical protein